MNVLSYFTRVFFISCHFYESGKLFIIHVVKCNGNSNTPTLPKEISALTPNEGVSYITNFKATYDNYSKGNNVLWPDTEENTRFYNLWKEQFKDLFSLYQINIEENAKRAYINYLFANVDNPRLFLLNIGVPGKVIQSRFRGDVPKSQNREAITLDDLPIIDTVSEEWPLVKNQ